MLVLWAPPLLPLLDMLLYPCRCACA